MVRQNLLYINELNVFLNTIDDAMFTTRSARHTFSGSIGAHSRHVIEFYRQFITSFTTGVIDYDRRERNGEIENSRSLAIEELSQIAAELNKMNLNENDMIEYAGNNKITPTSIGRELGYLAEHTVHHFALIRLIAEAEGFSFASFPDFGIAKSTLSYRTSQSRN